MSDEQTLKRRLSSRSLLRISGVAAVSASAAPIPIRADQVDAGKAASTGREVLEGENEPCFNHRSLETAVEAFVERMHPGSSDEFRMA